MAAKGVARVATRERLQDADSCRAVEPMGRGLIESDLGGVVEQWLARPGLGKSGGGALR